MKNLLSIFLMTLMFSLGAVAVEATLLPSTQSGVIFDNVANKYWLTDLNFYTDMTYTEQIQSINGRNDLGMSWHMASGDETRDLWLGNGGSFLDMFQATQGDRLFSGRIDTSTTWANGGDWEDPWKDSYTNGVDPAHTVAMFGWDGFMLAGDSGFNFFAYDDLSHHGLGAWVVSDGPVSVPEPATLLLFTLGIMGIKSSEKKTINVAH